MERIFRHPESGVEIITTNDIHATAFEQEGFVEVEQPESKKK
jgi:metal-dependent amidase/aminoacylase/carboxypeptidase family protein